jgi:hypothetical protein
LRIWSPGEIAIRTPQAAAAVARTVSSIGSHFGLRR